MDLILDSPAEPARERKGIVSAELLKESGA